METRVAFLLLTFTLNLISSTNGAGSISETLLQQLSNENGNGEIQEAVLELPSVLNQVLNNPFLNIFTGPLKIDMMTNSMKQLTSLAQAPFVAALKQLGVNEENIQPFWISNKISLKNVNLPLIEALQKFPFLSESFKIREPYIVNVTPEGDEVEPEEPLPSANEIQWGVQKIGAPSVWSKTKGAGITVANIDTGVNGNHIALKSNYGGKWLDAVKGVATPYDDNGHGTHTMGTIAGSARGIGVAPGAKWIACKALDAKGSGSDTWLSKCAQWVLQQKPKVVSNSWGGSGGQTWFNDEINAWVKAGIVPVFSIGNSGPKCKTAGSPGDQANVISVGSTTQNDAVSSFSSRGPASNGVMKPEVSAPGDGILSAGKSGNSYVRMSGTSMSCPHVAGAVALMIAAKPQLTFAQVKSTLESSADHPTVSSKDLQCGKPSNGGNYPNNGFGNGRINVKKAMGL